MREPINDKLRLEHILGAIDILLNGRAKYTFEQVTQDPIIFHGFVKHVEIIGEAVYMLSKQFKESHAEINWKIIEGMRHVLVHGYYQISQKQLWDTVDTDIEPLRPLIQELYNKA